MSLPFKPTSLQVGSIPLGLVGGVQSPFDVLDLTGVQANLRESQFRSNLARDFVRATPSYMTIADNASLSISGDSSFTWSHWVYIDNLAVSYHYAKYHNATNGAYAFLQSGGSRRFQFFVVASDDTLTLAEADETGDYVADQWYHCLGWYNDSDNTVNIRIDNHADWANDSVSHTAGIRDDALSLNFASNSVAGANFDGRLSEISFWKRILTDAEQDEVFNNGSPLGYEGYSSSLKTSLISHWPGHEASGNMLDVHGSNEMTDTNSVGTTTGAGNVKSSEDSRVTTVLDRTGAGNDYVQADATKAPLYKKNIVNGKGVLRFVATNDILVGPVLGTNTAGRIFVVCTTSDPSDVAQTVFAASDEAATDRYILCQITPTAHDGKQSLGQRNADTAAQVRGESIMIDDTFHIIEYGSNGTGWEFALDGLEDTTQTISGTDDGDWFGDLTGDDNTTIGGWKSTSEAQFFQGDIAEVVVLDHDATEGEKTLTRNDLATRYGLTLRGLLLDNITAPIGAYGLRKLRTAYTGSAIRVRETGGDTELDIGFDANGELDTSALMTHCGVNDGRVVTWYDQSGAAFDVTAAVDADEPEIVTAGSVNTGANGKPAITFNANGTTEALKSATNTGLTGTVAMSMYAVGAIDSWAEDFPSIIGQNPADDRDAMQIGGGNSDPSSSKPVETIATDTWGPRGVKGSDNAVTAGTDYLWTFVCSDWNNHRVSAIADTQLRLDRVAETPVSYGAVVTHALADNVLIVGNWDNTRTDMVWRGTLQEVILFNSEHSDADRDLMETQISRYFAIA